MVLMLVGACSAEPPSSSQTTEKTSAEVAQAVESALSLARPIDRLPALALALQSLNEGNLADVILVYSKITPPPTEYELLADQWAHFDPISAFEYAAELHNADARMAAMAAALRTWAIEDPQAAREMLEGRRGLRRGFPEKMKAALVSGWVRSPSGGVEAFLIENFDSGEDEVMSPAIYEVFRRDGAEGLMAWSESLINRSSDEQQSWRIFRKTVRRLTFSDAYLTIPWVMKHWGNKYAVDGPRILVETWTHYDPEAAFEWLRTEAPEESREEAMRMAFRFWFYNDREAAQVWLDSRPDDPFYLPAIDATARALVNSNPVKAASLCEQIPPGKMRQDCIRQVGVEWYRRDSIAAGRWLEQSDLSIEDREKIREWGLRGPGRGKRP